MLEDTVVFILMVIVRIGIPFVVFIELGRWVDMWTGVYEEVMPEGNIVESEYVRAK